MLFPADLVILLELMLPTATTPVLMELLRAVSLLLKRGALLAESQASRMLPLIIQQCTVRQRTPGRRSVLSRARLCLIGPPFLRSRSRRRRGSAWPRCCWAWRSCTAALQP